MIYEYNTSEKVDGYIKIYDIYGKIICIFVLNKEKSILQINITDIENGMYFYKTEFNNKTLETGKFIIQKQ